MSFLTKLQFWKKNDDFAFDTNMDKNYSFNENQQNFSNQENSWDQNQDYGLPPQDPYASQSFDDMNASKYEMPQDPYYQEQESMQQNNSLFRPIQQDQNETETDYGKRLARKYMSQQETLQQANQEPNQNYYSNNSSELLNLKIDAMKSDLALANQRLQKIEQLLELQVKQRGRY
jgi:hypothetical protein